MRQLLLLLLALPALAVSPLAPLSRGMAHRFLEDIPMREQMVDEMDQTNGWVIDVGTGGRTISTTDFVSGGGALLCSNTTAGTQFRLVKTIPMGTLPDLRAVSFWAKYSGDGVTVGRVQVWLSSRTDLSTHLNFAAYIVGAGNLMQPAGVWVQHTIPVTQMTMTGAEDFGSNFVRCLIRFDSTTSGTNAAFLIDRISLLRGGKAPNVLCPQFDNGHASVWTNALPVLRSNNIPATIWFAGGSAGIGGTIMTASQARECWSAGWDIGSKGWTYTVSLGLSNAADIATHLERNFTWLQNTNFTWRDDSGKFQAWTGGSYGTNSSAAAIALGLHYGRTTAVSNMNHRWSQEWSQPVMRANNADTPATVTNWLNAAIGTEGHVVNVFFHEINDSPGSTDYHRTNFLQLVDFLVREKSRLKLMTVPQWHRDRKRWLTTYDRP